MPHHLIDILHPSRGLVSSLISKCFMILINLESSHFCMFFYLDYSVGQFFEDGRQATKDILSRGRVPIVTGGTGLYLRWYIRRLITYTSLVYVSHIL